MGGLYGAVQPVYFCKKQIARDMGWFIYPEFRNTLAAVLLLADFERWAKEKGVTKILMTQSVGIDVHRTTKLFQHCGYTVCGTNTVKDI
jgi:hypothetical protein